MTCHGPTCTKPLTDRSPSLDFCGQACSEAWQRNLNPTAAQVFSRSSDVGMVTDLVGTLGLPPQRAGFIERFVGRRAA